MTIDISTAVHPVAAADVLGPLPGRPRVLALGEPTHGENVLLEVRNDLFRQLAVDAGYRTVAIESDCLAGTLVDDYVTGGAGDLDEVMERGFSHGFGAAPANRDLVRWMRACNQDRPAAERLRFAGFDGPVEISGGAGPRPALTALHTFLAARLDPGVLPGTAEELAALAGADQRWSDPAAMTDPSASAGGTPEAARLRLFADDLAALLDEEAPHLIATATPDEWDQARMHARTAVGLLRYHAAMADESPARLGRLLRVRSAMMAGTLLDLAARGPVLVFAHHSHLQRGRSSMRMGGQLLRWWSAGALVAERLGERYAVLATTLGTITHRGVGAPPADTVEGMLCALPGDRYVVDTRRLTGLLGDAAPPARESPWFGYAPLDPARLPDLDGLVFVRDAPEHPRWWVV